MDTHSKCGKNHKYSRECTDRERIYDDTNHRRIAFSFGVFCAENKEMELIAEY